MNYTVNWKNVYFPLWFHPILNDLAKKWSLKNAQWLEYVSALSRDKYVKEINFLSQARMEEIGREAWPLYIHTIDSYENKGWPQNIITGSKMDERGYALCRLADDILSLCDLKDPYFNCILQISDKLRDSLIICKLQYVDSFQALEKLKIIYSSQQAKYYEQRIFNAFTYNNKKLIEIACNWLEKKWISPIKYELEICKFVSQKMTIYSWSSYHSIEMLKLKVLQSIYKYPSVYRKAAALYDEEVRRYNLECFESYRRDKDNNPSDFKGLPFADGSCMKPIKRWFSWVLE
jgi:hypothetical protein